MIKQLKQNWAVLVLAAILTITGNIIFASWKSKAETLNDAASVEYVNTENAKQDEHQLRVNSRQDMEIRTLDEIKADRTEVNSIHSDVREIRATQLEMLQLLVKIKNEN